MRSISTHLLDIKGSILRIEEIVVVVGDGRYQEGQDGQFADAYDSGGQFDGAGDGQAQFGGARRCHARCRRRLGGGTRLEEQTAHGNGGGAQSGNYDHNFWMVLAGVLRDLFGERIPFLIQLL